MKLFFEKIYPYLLGLIASVLWLRMQGTTVSGIFVGFLATSKAILMSMSSPIIEELKRSGYIEELVSYIGQAIWINLLFCSINVIGYFVSTQAEWYSLIWIFISVCALATFIRVTHIMLKIFKHG